VAAICSSIVVINSPLQGRRKKEKLGKTKWIELRFGLGRVEANLEIKKVQITPMRSKNRAPIVPHHNKFQRSTNKGEICFRLAPPGGVYQCKITANHQGRTEEHTPELILNAKSHDWSWKNLLPIFHNHYQISFYTISSG